MARAGSEFTAGYHRAHPPSAPASPTIGATSRRPRTASAAADPERAAERFLEEHRGFRARRNHTDSGFGVGAGAGIEGGSEPRFDARPGTSAGADAVAATLSRAAALASAPSPSRLAAAYGSYPAPRAPSRGGVPARGGARSALRPRDARADRVRADELPALRRRQSRAKWPRARVLFGGARLRRLAARRARDGVSARATARAPTTARAPCSLAHAQQLAPTPAPVPALPTAATVPVSPAASSRCVRRARGDGESGRVRRLRVPTRDARERRWRRGGGVPSVVGDVGRRRRVLAVGEEMYDAEKTYDPDETTFLSHRKRACAYLRGVVLCVLIPA